MILISKLRNIYIEAADLSRPVRNHHLFQKVSWWTPNLEAQKDIFIIVKIFIIVVTLESVKMNIKLSGIITQEVFA
ncbi:hypothetical protein DERF_005032 [Dermatophagoides farinae]|uniref:Uncharacterized protein n=1 Tax=Dermatophagoides farinae TaxID=6954 RepID=A0A922I523_DERFA|nr:hypothetical protein DERF_005032 [Dermatophagoides farinae]